MHIYLREINLPIRQFGKNDRECHELGEFHEFHLIKIKIIIGSAEENSGWSLVKMIGRIGRFPIFWMKLH